MTQDKAFMTINEFCAETKSHRSTINRWIKSGVIRSVKIGKKRLIPTAELLMLIKTYQ